MVVEIVLLVVHIGRGIFGVEVSLSVLTVVIPQGNVGENLTEVAHVNTFHSPLFPTVTLPRLLVAFGDTSLIPATAQPVPLRHEVDSDAGTSCGQWRVVLLVTIVRQLQAELQQLTCTRRGFR